jgi:hypothetical protein
MARIYRFRRCEAHHRISALIADIGAGLSVAASENIDKNLRHLILDLSSPRASQILFTISSFFSDKADFHSSTDPDRVKQGCRYYPNSGHISFKKKNDGGPH